MVGIDGELRGKAPLLDRLRTHGIAYPIPDSTRTPFTTVTFLRPELSLRLVGTMNYSCHPIG
jgi:hypothetical protein